jgi:hypothetical protein
MDRLAAPQPADTVLRSQPAEIAAIDAEPARGRWPWLVAAAVAVLGIIGVSVIVLTRGAAPAVLPDTDKPTVPSGAAVDVGVPVPSELGVSRHGKDLVFTWANPDPRPGDSFQWRRTDTDTAGNAQSVTEMSVTVADSHACIAVILVRDNGQSSDPAKLCSKDG